MRFLVPSGGAVSAYGYLTSPAHAGILPGIRAGRPWAADNEAFTRGFEPDRFFGWLAKLEPYRMACLFVTVPDVVGNAEETLESWHQWRPAFAGWPLAFVAQDGQEDRSLPAEFDALFVGGSTEWKLSSAAAYCIQGAQQLGKHIHIGRVNWRKRYAHFRLLAGSDLFTCDGTRPRFEGLEPTLKAWRGYEAQPPLMTF